MIGSAGNDDASTARLIWLATTNGSARSKKTCATFIVKAQLYKTGNSAKPF